MGERGERETRRVHLPLQVEAPRVELLGQSELLLEHYKGILSCEKNEIHVDGGAWVLRIRGQELVIRTMREYELRITGRVDSLELM